MERHCCNEPFSFVKLVVCVVTDRVSPSDLVSIVANRVKLSLIIEPLGSTGRASPRRKDPRF